LEVRAKLGETATPSAILRHLDCKSLTVTSWPLFFRDTEETTKTAKTKRWNGTEKLQREEPKDGLEEKAFLLMKKRIKKMESLILKRKQNIDDSSCQRTPMNPMNTDEHQFFLHFQTLVLFMLGLSSLTPCNIAIVLP